MQHLMDVHAHILPLVFLQRVKEGCVEGVSLSEQGLFFGPNRHPCTKPFYDVDTQLALMDERGIAMQAISITPRLFFYERSGEWNAEFCRACNQEILDRCAAHPERFLPVGHIPMQDAQLAVEEMAFLHQQGVRMIQIGTTVNGLCLDDASFDPVYAALEKYGMVLMLHPLIVNQDPQTKRHHLSNAVGNPYQTSAAAGNLIAGGVFDRYPALQVMLVHGGGFLPFQAGRMDHAYNVRPQAEFSCLKKPSDYIRTNLLFDDLLYMPEAMQLQRSMAGEERIFYGTDYPYDMAAYARSYDEDAVQRMNARTLRLFAPAQ